MFTKTDEIQIKQKGFNPEYLAWQVEMFKNGVPYINLDRPATIGDGINILQNPEEYIKLYNNSNLQIVKFVPASGAATRMFKALFEERSRLENKAGKIVFEDINDAVKKFLSSIKKFAFYEKISSYADELGGLDYLIKNGEYIKILDLVLNEKYLNYGNLPKGLIHFHKYKEYVRKAIEEHLVEGALYGKSANNTVNIHFTVSPEHLDSFKDLISEKQKNYEKRYNVTYNISFSIQKISTDTMAVTPQNEPFRDVDGNILFRPAGHGALIENLNDLSADIVFIKNIDNVVPEYNIDSTVRYKKSLAGVLIHHQNAIHTLLNKIDREGEKSRNEALKYIKDKLQLNITDSISLEEIRSLLNRPIRVCGVVKNVGEPGGGPYWVKDSKGFLSLQIVESSQMDLEDSTQKEIFNNSTHFNPVDLVCGIIDYQGNKFDLKKYIDNNTCFISHKSKDGKQLKALELPGLWNGAMANWISFFVKVPLDTFNPVKTINDLLRKEHQ